MATGRHWRTIADEMVCGLLLKAGGDLSSFTPDQRQQAEEDSIYLIYLESQGLVER